MSANPSLCISVSRPILIIAASGCLFLGGAQAEVASVYGGAHGLCGTRTANGERLNCADMTAAQRTLPFGAQVRVCHRGCVVVRHIDLRPAAAHAIGLKDVGRVSLARNIDPRQLPHWRYLHRSRTSPKFLKWLRAGVLAYGPILEDATGCPERERS